ncbi:MAG TPA: hypothetical protein V6D19_21705 [Stenomitos sp.]
MLASKTLIVRAESLLGTMHGPDKGTPLSILHDYTTVVERV